MAIKLSLKRTLTLNEMTQKDLALRAGNRQGSLINAENLLRTGRIAMANHILLSCLPE